MSKPSQSRQMKQRWEDEKYRQRMLPVLAANGDKAASMNQRERIERGYRIRRAHELKRSGSQ